MQKKLARVIADALLRAGLDHDDAEWVGSMVCHNITEHFKVADRTDQEAWELGPGDREHLKAIVEELNTLYVETEGQDVEYQTDYLAERLTGRWKLVRRLYGYTGGERTEQGPPDQE